MVIQTWIDFKVEADPIWLELVYAVRIDDDDFNKWDLI